MYQREKLMEHLLYTKHWARYRICKFEADTNPPSRSSKFSKGKKEIGTIPLIII